MSPTWATVVLAVLAAYFAAGGLFAVVIAVKGLARIDAGACDMPWSARLLVLPGLVALWPLVLVKCLKQTGAPVS